MKLFSLFMILSALTYLEDTVKGFIPKEFLYPEEKIGTGKIFVYQNIDTKQQTFSEIKLINSDGKTYRTIKSYDNNHTVSDSSKIFNGETIEIYNFNMSENGVAIKGQIIQDTVLDNQQKLGVRISKITYHTNQLLYTIISSEKYLKDTTLVWKNGKVPCILTQADSRIELQSIEDTTLKHSIYVMSKHYYGKSVGTVKYSIEFIDQNGKENNNTFELVDIK